MAKPEWGTKRMCPGCGIRFYDMKKRPVKCPACETAVPTEVATRTRKSAPAAAKVIAPPVVDKPAEAEAPGVEDLPEDATVKDVEVEVEDEDNDDDDSLIEDTSDLGENDDIPEISEHMETDGDTES